MSLELSWLRPEAPYSPVVTVGLLAALRDAGVEATAAWQRVRLTDTLTIATAADPVRIGQAIIDAPWPRLDRIWAGRVGQAIKPMLAAEEDPAAELRRLRAAVDAADLEAAAAHEPRLLGERRLLRALVTDAVLDGGGVPSRSRLLRGVKADLSGVAERVPASADDLAQELVDGPVWQDKKSGRGLGFVPEVQTFGGTTGRTPSDVGSHSRLLYRLLWLGLLELPPIAVMRRGRRVVGGPLFTDVVGGEFQLSWPTWSFPVSLRGLVLLIGLADIHAAQPDERVLHARGITSVRRTISVPISSNLSVFRWGERVA